MRVALACVFVLALVGCGSGPGSGETRAEVERMIEERTRLQALPYAVGEVQVTVTCTTVQRGTEYRCLVSASDDTGPYDTVVRATCDGHACVWNPE